MQRIERAVARIEKAAAARAYATDAIARRHARLRQRMNEAVEALDGLLEREERKGDEA
ncbi:hypothetical protein [Stakelama saccharophila]|uniref:Uncharacterized protein n=1 Tax=Stakelama saccharophila TaxID=3075605 RepID=A0ABZ0BCH9_9SPHN|nr:hypothetical protein [Stakelama sp. W311]WNO54993.1 hypothetical protein RPR59_07050 [Stakelama sp. W311]